VNHREASRLVIVPLALVVTLGATLGGAPAAASEVETLLLPASPAARVAPHAFRLADTVALEPLAALEPLSLGAADDLAALTAWNLAGRVPSRNGVTRPLPLSRQVELDPRLAARLAASGGAVRYAGGAAMSLPGGSVVWSGEVEVAGAWRIRLHLADAQLPAATRLWISTPSGDEEVFFLAGDVLRDGALWTPSVAGPVARLEIEVPAEAAASARFTLDRALELVALDETGAPRPGAAGAMEPALEAATTTPPCLVTPACAASSAPPSLEAMRRATARLQFVLARDGFSYLCSGGLLNDTDEGTTHPYLLTANHCIPDDATAATLEAVFDYAAASCGGAAPAGASLPRVAGARLLSTGADADFTLLLLGELPPGRALLGWTSEVQAGDVPLHRVSHPNGLPQGYSRTVLTASGTSCGTKPRDHFLYSQRVEGGVFHGSSGSLVARASDGKVVGQLSAACGPASVVGDGCHDANYVVDGRLSAAWPRLAPWLAPSAAGGPCLPGATTLCLGAGDRFAVTARFAAGGLAGEARTVELTADTGYLWFFDAANVETVVKVLDGCAANGRFWVFAGGLTNVEVELTVTDTLTGAAKTYANPAGRAFQPVQDTSALACD
jgi:hypothetical protein